MGGPGTTGLPAGDGPVQMYGHIAESSSNYRKPKMHYMLRGAVSNATMAHMLLLKGLGMPTKQCP